MSKLLILLLVVIALPTAIKAENVWLLIKSSGYGNGATSFVVPMDSMKQCEEQGTKVIQSERFDNKHLKQDSYECVYGR